jgi:hypothetical protein
VVDRDSLENCYTGRLVSRVQIPISPPEMLSGTVKLQPYLLSRVVTGSSPRVWEILPTKEWTWLNDNGQLKDKNYPEGVRYGRSQQEGKTV